MTRTGLLFATASLAILPTLAFAECKVEGTGEVSVLMNFFPTTQVLDAAMEACERESATRPGAGCIG